MRPAQCELQEHPRALSSLPLAGAAKVSTGRIERRHGGVPTRSLRVTTLSVSRCVPSIGRASGAKLSVLVMPAGRRCWTS